MRPIKFKVWDKESGKFICCYQEGLRFAMDTGQIYINGTNFTQHFILCQYTGLKDRKDNEVYEGDILRWTSVRGDTEDGAVIYGEEKRDTEPYGFNITIADMARSEIIGNIYENPDLPTVN